METLNITSRMPHFKLISRICGNSATHLKAEAMLNGAPLYAGVEIMAQAAALHVRKMLDFKRHAFLLSIQQCSMPRIGSLKGLFKVSAIQAHRSSAAFSYSVAARGPEGVDFDGELLIGTRGFDERFSQAKLSAHYRQLWARLRDA